jgi:hypothetical protein
LLPPFLRFFPHPSLSVFFNSLLPFFVLFNSSFSPYFLSIFPFLPHSYLFPFLHSIHPSYLPLNISLSLVFLFR